MDNHAVVSEESYAPSIKKRLSEVWHKDDVAGAAAFIRAEVDPMNASG